MTRTTGMSLVEVLVAITVLALIGVMVASAFSQTARNKQRVEDEADRYHEVRIALERMQREISMAYVSSQLNENTALRVVNTTFVSRDRAEADRLDFTSFSHQRLYRNAHESDQNEISYFLTRHPETRLQVLARREQNRIDDDPERGGHIEVLASEVRELDFEFLDPQTMEWVSEWNATPDSGAQANRLPMQVKISLTVPNPHDPDEDQTFVTRTWIPITWALNHATYNP